MNQVTIDFVTVRPDGSYCLRLREVGPWDEDATEALKRIQDRLCTAVEVIADGKFIERFPESKGKKIFIMVDCFKIREESITPFFNRFVSAIRTSPEWALDCEAISFELHHLGEEVQRTG